MTTPTTDPHAPLRESITVSIRSNGSGYIAVGPLGDITKRHAACDLDLPTWALERLKDALTPVAPAPQATSISKLKWHRDSQGWANLIPEDATPDEIELVHKIAGGRPSHVSELQWRLNLQSIASDIRRHVEAQPPSDNPFKLTEQFHAWLDSLGLMCVKKDSSAPATTGAEVGKLVEALEPLANIARIADLYLGAPCFNKKPLPDSHQIAYYQHGEDEQVITLGMCRQARSLTNPVPLGGKEGGK